MKQQLSALIDGEADLTMSEHVIQAARSNGEVAKAWTEYHLISDIISGDGVYTQANYQTTMVSRVLAALDEEATILAPNVALSATKSSPNAIKKTKFWAVATSVAASFFVALFVWNLQSDVTLEPVNIAEEAGSYVYAHHAYAPSSVSYYIQNTAYSEQ